MQDIIQNISVLFVKTFNEKPTEITLLEQSGSDRKYFRIKTNEKTLIATSNANISENETFFYLTHKFNELSIKVPKIFAISDDKTIYIQSDLGKTNLLETINKFGFSDKVVILLKKAIENLVKIQIEGDKYIDYTKCYVNDEFGKHAIFSDLLYFKYYFADTLKINYNNQNLIKDFEKLSINLSGNSLKYFMYRDFQSRNIMVNENDIFFIDYQGGMKGPVLYDIASFLWQAKAKLPNKTKEYLFNFYIDKLEENIKSPINRINIKNQYKGFVLLRLLQVLGAYGFRGIFERKTHFLDSIPPALQNLKTYLNDKIPDLDMPELDNLLKKITLDAIIDKFSTVKSNKDTQLKIKIKSFSYIKTGYPSDESEHRGGFVFDCRGILNPGRIEEYKNQNGRDSDVIYFLEQNTSMPDFLNNAFGMIDISVSEYIKRGFQSLSISFGCTGGQHRSVYAADKLAKYLFDKYNVCIELTHIEQKINETLNPKS
ncbi:MAG: phosphotransferase [Bacteroidetes bacterium]|nr:phosphotransferase [Bacteroidota bacterium]